MRRYSLLPIDICTAGASQGPIYQYVDAATMSLVNVQTLTPVGKVPVPTSVKAELTALADNRLGVKFTQFGVGVAWSHLARQCIERRMIDGDRGEADRSPFSSFF